MTSFAKHINIFIETVYTSAHQGLYLQKSLQDFAILDFDRYTFPVIAGCNFLLLALPQYSAKSPQFLRIPSGKFSYLWPNNHNKSSQNPGGIKIFRNSAGNWNKTKQNKTNKPTKPQDPPGIAKSSLVFFFCEVGKSNKRKIIWPLGSGSSLGKGEI